jgi:hypothetical protein
VIDNISFVCVFQRIFPVLSDLFNHLCDDEIDLLSSKFDNKTTNNTNTSLLDQISLTSPKSFKLNLHSTFNKSPISSTSNIRKLISPLSSTIDQTNSHLSSLESEHIPLFKRPLFQSNNQQQHSSSAYINLRNPSSIHVNS